ncbi:phosphotransferase IIA-like nitrogen-regulatory protein PtsN [Maritalea mobilis]|uniref:Phosphotransferase IIA-like nitrogen-regulatory protein PtsN n=1 Tax=Maritalea mobilis TaxID=483324 RepID=A0A4R6VH24_9HYPH|nr:PTS sugar transporter subunit IIA [Maritalea mobilis]TDQ62141.1 phosphotransferase IIA-like nitrogen-regulatory protein PtsN [Maritalea mobilis]
MEIAQILASKAILPCAKVTCKRQLLQLAAEQASELVGIDAHQIFETLQEREQLGSTGLGEGIAIPHGKLKGLDGVHCILIRLEHGIEFDAVDDKPVDLAFVLLAPQGSGADHLKALSRIARLTRTPGLMERLRQLSSTSDIHEFLTREAEETNAA